MNKLTNKDLSILRQSENFESRIYSIEQYNDIVVEMSIYDREIDSLIFTMRQSLFDLYKAGLITRDSAGNVSFNTPDILKRNNFGEASYTVHYTMYKNVFGSDITNSLFVKTISPSRKELQITSADLTLNSEFGNFVNTNFFRYTNDLVLNKYINFDYNRLFLVLNAMVESDTLIIKLYEPLPDDINDKVFLWFVELLSEPIIENVSVYDTIDNTIKANFLAPPKFEYVDADIKLDNRSFNSNYVTYDDFKNKFGYNSNTKLISDIDFSKTDILKHDFNIDYTDFSSYCRFGSMRARLDNYVTKLKLIEAEQAQLDELSSGIYDKFDTYNKNDVSSVKYISSKKITEIYEGFTSFEKAIHYSTELYFESDEYPGETLDLSVPKTGTTISTFVYKPTTSTDFTDWYEKISNVLTAYDIENRDGLINLVPSFIKDDYVYDESNEFYLKLVDLAGEFFDSIFLYINNIENISNRSESRTESAPNQILWNILYNSGFEMNTSTDIFDLSRFLYGYYLDNLNVKTVDVSDKEFTREVWKRLLNNIPLLLKTKGTRNSIRYLMNCYGIPNNYIVIQEFGGPKIRYFDSTYNDSNMFDFVEFTHYLNIGLNEKLIIPWTTSSFTNKYPDGVELRFKLNSSSPNTLFMIGTGSQYISVTHNNTYNDFGYLTLTVASASNLITGSTSIINLYNNEFYYLNLKRLISSDDITTTGSYELRLVDYDSYINKITYDNSITISGSYFTNVHISSSNLYIQNTVESIDEFRIWHEILDDDVITYHSMFAYATNGNTLSSSLDYLSFRLSMDMPKNLYLTASLENEGYAKQYYDYTASAINFTSMSAYPWNYGYMERANTVLHKHTFTDGENAKIRIEENWLPYRFITSSNGTGSVEVAALYGNYKIQGDRIPYHKSEFDDDTPDSNVLIVGISPIGLSNNDIYSFFGNTNLFDELADFDTNYKTSYGTLDELSNLYWTNTKNPIDYRDYFRYFELYDVGLFKQIKEFIPAKMNAAVGKIHTENVLRRTKVKLIDKEIAEYSDPKEKEINVGELYNTKTTQNNAISEKQNIINKYVKLSIQSVNDFGGNIDGNVITPIENIVENNVGSINMQYIKSVDSSNYSVEGYHDVNILTNTDSNLNSYNMVMNNKVFDVFGKELYQDIVSVGINNTIDGILIKDKEDVIELKPETVIYKFNERKLNTEMQYSVRKPSIKKTVKKSAYLSSNNTIDGKPPVIITLSNKQNLKVSYTDTVKLVKK